MYDRVKKAFRAGKTVYCLTNLVAVYPTALLLTGCGARPIMTRAPSEQVEAINGAAALSINLGTPDDLTVHQAEQCRDLAAARNLPIVLDPAGAALFQHRCNKAKRLLEKGITLLRCNGAELAALTGRPFSSAGLDSLYLPAVEEGRRLAAETAAEYKTSVCLTGPHCFLSDGTGHFDCPGGTPLMTQVTACGCCLSAFLAAILADGGGFEGLKEGLDLFNSTARTCAESLPKDQGPLQFAAKFFDRLASEVKL